MENKNICHADGRRCTQFPSPSVDINYNKNLLEKNVKKQGKKDRWVLYARARAHGSSTDVTAYLLRPRSRSPLDLDGVCDLHETAVNGVNVNFSENIQTTII